VASDSVVLPIAVAAERSALSEEELLAHPYCQIFTRYLSERDPEIAVVLPVSLIPAPDPLPRTYPELDAL
jgi:hypothetical protein